VKTLTILVLLISFSALAAPPSGNSNGRSKFYDFGEQVIDGEIRRPTALYTDARKRAQFDRLLRLKRSFLPDLFETAKEKVFK
tara:strand:+ start:1348 stop:1596 length:249 start_codon:yes stop_codon:yes gene_type:complete